MWGTLELTSVLPDSKLDVGIRKQVQDFLVIPSFLAYEVGRMEPGWKRFCREHNSFRFTLEN